MSALFSTTSSKARLIEFFIEDHSHWQKPTAFILKKLYRVFEKPIFNEHRFNALMVAADRCFDRPSPDDFPQDLKNRIEKLSTELEVGKRGYAIAYKYEIGASLQYMLKLFDSNIDDGNFMEATEKHLLILSKGCNVYQYLDKSHWESLRLIAVKFPTIEKCFGQILQVDSRGYEIFNRIKTAIKPVLENSQNRYEEPEAPVIPTPSDVEYLASIENWEAINPDGPICGPSSSHQVPAKSENRVKLKLVGIIESITDRILLHYGATFVNLLTNPLTQAFQTEKLQSIVEDVLSKKAAQFSPEEKKIWKEFLCSSLPSTACNFLSMTTDKMSDPTKGYEFIHGITKMISPFCFKTPETIGHHHKMLILNILPQITLFLRDYQTSVDLIKQFPFVSKEQQENDILCAMIQNLHSRTSKLIFRNEQDPQIFAEDLNRYIETVILEQCQASKIALPSPIKESVVAIVNHYAYTVFDSLLSPFAIAVVIRRLVDSEEKLQVPEESSSVPPATHIPDDQFSSALSMQFWDAIKPILNMGGNPKLISWFIEAFDGTIKKELFSRARTVNKELHNVLASDCVLMPFLIMDKLLFDHDGKEVTPALRELLRSDKDYQAKFAEETIRKFKDRPYTIVSKLIRKETSRLTLMLAEAIGNLDTFLITLFNQLIDLSTQEKILKLLIVYLCDGYLNYLRETSEK